MSKFCDSSVFGGRLSAAAAICLGAIAIGGLTTVPAQAAQWCHTDVGPVGPNGEPGAEFYHCDSVSNAEFAEPTAFKYAAIAVSSGTRSDSQLHWGSASWYSSQNDANLAALNSCRANGGQACKVEAKGSNTYLSLAISSNNAWAPAYGNTPQSANAMALAKCWQNGGGTSCVIEPRASASSVD
jgi:hypothetical protein